MQNICVVIYHDEHEACKYNSEQLALLSALKTLMSFSICGKPQIFLLQQNICCLLPMEFLSWNQVQLYHILFLTLHKSCFFLIFQYQIHTSSHLNLNVWKSYLSLKTDLLAFLSAVIICRFLIHAHVDETKQCYYVFPSTNTVFSVILILVTKHLSWVFFIKFLYVCNVCL